MNDTPRKYIPLIVKVFALHSKKDKGKEEYCLRKFKIENGRVEGKNLIFFKKLTPYKVQRFLNANLTFKEQGIKSGNCIVVLSLQLFFEVTQKILKTRTPTKINTEITRSIHR